MSCESWPVTSPSLLSTFFHFSRTPDPAILGRVPISTAAWEFINGAGRTKLWRVTSLDAHRAAKEAPAEVSRLAAQAAGDAASAAYLHPIAKAHQVGHILRAATNAARNAEIEAGDDPAVGDKMIERASERATPTLIGVLHRYPVAPTGKSRAAQLMTALDASLRAYR